MKASVTIDDRYINGKIAANIEKIRKTRSLTYRAIALKLGVTDATAFRYCQPDDPPKTLAITQLMKLSKTFNVPLTSLIGLDNAEMFDKMSAASKAMEIIALLNAAGQAHALMYLSDLAMVKEYRKNEDTIPSPAKPIKDLHLCASDNPTAQPETQQS